MRTMIAAGLLAMAPLGVPSLQQTPPTPPAATAPAAQPLPAKTAGAMEAPKLPPFAGEIVNFDRRGARVVACVDASKVQTPPRPGPDGKPVPAPPAPPPGPPRLRIWVLEREVMQELMTTGGLCDPSWSPDGKTFAATGVRGVFTFTEPNFEPRVLVAGRRRASTTIRPGRRAAAESPSAPAPAASRVSRWWT